MTMDAVSSRYAGALFDLAKREGTIDQTAEQFGRLHGLLRDHASLRGFLLNPDVETEQKLSVLDRLMAGWSKDVRAFVQVVLSWGRAAHLAAMAEAFQQLVDQERKVVRVRLRSARPLPEAQKQRLVAWIVKRERRSVQLEEEVDPALLGGLQIALDHRILDGSVRTQLDALRHRMNSVRVH